MGRGGDYDETILKTMLFILWLGMVVVIASLFAN
tara:strand:+ start:276 stop:377 length:102 start_codon:yes stop_codon:yes gene_type:complete